MSSFSAVFAEAELDPHIVGLDLHGSPTDGIDHVIDLFLDQAFCKGERVVKIIHGKGSGALRDATLRFLKMHAHVAATHQSLRTEEMGAVVYAALKPRV